MGFSIDPLREGATGAPAALYRDWPQHVGDVAPVVVPIFAVPCESGTKPVPPRHVRLPPQLPQLDSSEIVNLLGEMATKSDG
jgi:hypothetical protein